MSESTSPQPNPLIDTATVPSPALRAPNSGLIATVPALLLFGLGFTLSGPPSPQPITDALTMRSDEAIDAAAVVPISQTLVVANKQAAGYSLLRGELRPIIRATGQAPISGQVAQVSVRSGQSVNVGDRVLQISTAVATRPSAGAERAQSAAEAAQVAAAKQQDALQAKMQKAQARLREAQLRVDAAQRGVAKARDLVAKLRRDGTTNAVEEPVAKPALRDVAPSAAMRAAEKARREAEATAREAERATAKAAVARRAIDAAEADVKQKKQKQQAAEANVDKVQEDFEAKTSKGSEVEAARTAAADARSEVSEAEQKVSAAREEAEKLASVAQSAGAKAKQLADTAQKLEQKVPAGERVAGAKGAQSTPAPRKRSQPNSNITIEQAARIVAAAVAESDSAIKSVETIKREVDGYERLAQATHAKIDSSSSRLEAAQERVMEHTIQANLSSVRAPATGTVSWVTQVATEVSFGDRLITIVHPNMLEVQLRDYSGAWRQLKAGATLPAIVQTGQTSPDAGARPNTARMNGGDARPVVQPAALMRGNSNTVATTVRLRAVTPPAKPGAPALLRAVVYNPPQTGRGNGSAGRQLRIGLPILCSVTKPGAQPAMNIPVAAIHSDAQGVSTVAVLSPIEAATTGDTVVPMEETYRIEWREVKLGKGDGIQQVVESGLLPGDRIALQPAELQAITLSHGPEATIRLATT